MTKIINAKTSSNIYTRVILNENKIQLKHAMIIFNTQTCPQNEINVKGTYKHNENMKIPLE